MYENVDQNFISTNFQDTNVLAFSISGSAGVDLTRVTHTRNTEDQQTAGMVSGGQSQTMCIN